MFVQFSPRQVFGFPLRRPVAALGLSLGLSLSAPALLAQTPAAPGKPAPAAAVKTAPAPAPTPTPAAAPLAAPAPAANGANGASPAQAGAPADPNAPAVPPPLSDVIFTNGEVITLDDKKPSAQAVAIKGSKIIAVGTTKAVLARWKSEGTEVVDLAGKTLAPGFIDAWGNLSRLGLFSVVAPLHSPPEGSITDVGGLLRTLRDWGKGEVAQRTGWIIGFGFDDSRLREQRSLSRNDLDGVSRDKPVIVIHHSGRQLVANGKALELAGIGRDSADPAGGRIGRWPGSREPDGSLDGAAAVALLGSLPGVSKDERQILIQQAQGLYLKNGYTTASEARATPTDLTLYTEAADTGALKLDVAIYADLAASGASLKGHKSVGPRYYKNRIRLAGVSFGLDGVAQDRSAWLSQPYQLPPPGKRSGFVGYALASDDSALELATRAYANGWPLAVEANGDAAIAQFINAARGAADKHPAKDRHPLLVGAQTVRDEQLDALRELGAATVLMPQRLGLSLAALQGDTLGRERSARFAPAAAVLARSLPLSLAHDPALPEPAPLALMAAAMKRPIGEGENLSALDALKALTLVPARQIGEDKTKGSIAVGKFADLVVLSANPLRTPVDGLRDIRVLGTVKEGVTVFGGPEGGVPLTH